MKKNPRYHFTCYAIGFILSMLLLPGRVSAQNNVNKNDHKKQFKVKDNVMYIHLSKDLPKASLDSFTSSYSLRNVGLYSLLHTGRTDSVQQHGWKLETSENGYYTLSKKLTSGTDIKKSMDRIVFSAIPTPDNWRIVGGNKVIYGINNFRNRKVFEQKAGVTYFFLKGFKRAKSVRLAGNFTNWQHAAFPMTKTEEGWIAPVRLEPGQYFYKFIVDDYWITDPDNFITENDGQGNINSVYYTPNKNLFLKGYQNAGSVMVTGSFNNWRMNGLPLEKKDGGWQISLYLETGTYKYKFIVDGKLITENDQGSNASAKEKIALGTSYSFILKGFKDARKVSLAGNFNDWNPDDTRMEPTTSGWLVSYVLGPGNYQYKFVVDGKWITDPGNPNIVSDSEGNLNSFLVVSPNYTFRLNGYERASHVNLAGEFNNWSPKGLSMTRAGNEWICQVYLARGKHLYKYIVDGKWIKDPNNPLWEDDDNNSVLWIE